MPPPPEADTGTDAPPAWQADLLTLVGHWQAVPDADAAALLAHARPVRLAAGEELFAIGEPADACVLLADGIVRAYYIHADDERAVEVNLRLISAPAAALPFAAFISGQPADECLQALTPVVGYHIRLRALCAAHPGEFTETLRRILAETHAAALHNRLRMLQHQRAAQRYAHFLRTMPDAVIRHTPGYHVASYLGLSPESLSRVRTQAARRAGND